MSYTVRKQGMHMSLDDRDWYRDVLRERAGLKPKWQLWKSKRVPSADVRHNPHYVKELQPWHPVLQILLFAVICLFTFLILRFFKH